MVQDPAPLTALAFDASGAGLITATASNQLAVYNVESLAATDWTKLHGGKLPARLLNMPGSIASISPHPQTAEIVVATPSSACHISLLHQPPIELKTASKNPWGSEYPYQSVNTAQNGSDPGENFRVLPMQHPVLLLAYTSPSSLLLVRPSQTHSMAQSAQFAVVPVLECAVQQHCPLHLLCIFLHCMSLWNSCLS